MGAITSWGAGSFRWAEVCELGKKENEKKDRAGGVRKSLEVGELEILIRPLNKEYVYLSNHAWRIVCYGQK
jgi:hypothetical protein